MLSIIHLSILLAAVWYCAYHKLSFWLWVPLLALLLSIMHYGHFLSPVWQSFSCLIFGATTLLFGIPWLRHKLLTYPILRFFKQALPPISQTEQEALEAGDMWWEQELFCGKPQWQKLLSQPKSHLSEAEQHFLNNEVTTLCSMLDDWQIVQKDCDLPLEVWDYLKKAGFLGLIIPKEYGGLGFSALAHSTIITKIATRSASAAVNVMVPNSLGPGELLIHYGTEAQKAYYLPRLARGEEIPCFALTANEAGSDAAAMTDYGIVCYSEYQGQKTLGMRLTWDKRYITLAPIATLLGLAFKLKDPDHLLSDQTDIGITLCLIPTDHPGVQIGRRHLPLNMAFMNGPTQGADVFVPLDWIIGGPSMAGKGWKMLMECLAMGRGISLPALSAANSQLAYRMTGIYGRLRKQFKLPIGKFSGVAQAMGRIGAYSYLLNACRIFTASAVDLGLKPALASAIAKYQMTEMLRKSVDAAMDIHAGRAIQLGPRNYLAHAYQAVPIAITVEGANILTRNLIVFGQGALRCHPYLRHEMAAAADKQGFKTFDRLLTRHIGYTVSNIFRALWMGITAGRWIKVPYQQAIKPYYQQLTRISTALALVSDIALVTLGGELKKQESLSARLGDLLSQLYLASSVLKYYQDLHAQPDDTLYVQWILQQCLYDSQQALVAFFQNFQNQALATVLCFLVFPLGLAYQPPKDTLTEQLAVHMMAPSKLRERLTNLCYFNKKPDDAIWRMEHAFELALQTEAIQQKIQHAIKNGQLSAHVAVIELYQQAQALNIIDETEKNALLAAENARLDAMKVDDFPQNTFVRPNL